MPKEKKKKPPEFERGKERGFREGRRQGREEGYEFLMYVLLLVLQDKHGMDKEKLMKIHCDIQSYTKMVSDGTVTIPNLRQALKNEYNITFRWV